MFKLIIPISFQLLVFICLTLFPLIHTCKLSPPHYQTDSSLSTQCSIPSQFYHFQKCFGMHSFYKLLIQHYNKGIYILIISAVVVPLVILSPAPQIVFPLANHTLIASSTTSHIPPPIPPTFLFSSPTHVSPSYCHCYQMRRDTHHPTGGWGVVVWSAWSCTVTH